MSPLFNDKQFFKNIFKYKYYFSVKSYKYVRWDTLPYKIKGRIFFIFKKFIQNILKAYLNVSQGMF